MLDNFSCDIWIIAFHCELKLNAKFVAATNHTVIKLNKLQMSRGALELVFRLENHFRLLNLSSSSRNSFRHCATSQQLLRQC